ncbi:hypothetical protein V1264_020250 [Littorina saxatilis]|uniref:Sushi domain-containing protein n=1 Tax=Littorina saxatilis TaxID=31220 RepID=A0AAN9BC79_9CAEN
MTSGTTTSESTSAPTTSDVTTTTTIPTTTPDPVRCNGDPPPPGQGSSLKLLAPGVLVYTCNPGFVEKRSGSSVVRCDVNATSWTPNKGLVCEPPEEESVVPPWLIVTAVSVAGAAVLTALLFLLAYICRWCGVCHVCNCARADSACCKRQARVNQAPSHVTQSGHVDSEPSNHVTRKEPVARILVYDDYLVRQKEFL